MPKDHVFRMAARIHQRLLRQSAIPSLHWQTYVSEVLLQAQRIDRHFQLAQTARQRDWQSAAASEITRVMDEVGKLESAVNYLRQTYVVEAKSTPPPTLSTVIAELLQVHREFDNFEIDLKQNLVGVCIGPITLEDVELGPFTIELHVNNLRDRPSADCFRISAVEPNPASSNESVIHPHVDDHRLCAGVASVPINTALAEGRLADAFILVRSVLQNYNPDSPYVSLENWSGRRCSECDYVTDSEHTYTCEHCGKDVCEDCYSSCDLCDEGSCRSCLETDEVTGNRCCSSCRHTCEACDRTVDSDTFDEASDLCPQCLAKRRKEEKHDNESDHTTGADAGSEAATPPPPSIPAAA